MTMLCGALLNAVNSLVERTKELAVWGLQSSSYLESEQSKGAQNTLKHSWKSRALLKN